MKLALKVDVDTYHGTRRGVPRVAELLAKRGIGATFLFSLGPDHTGRALRRALRPGFLDKVRRTSVLEHYGLRTLLYGTLLPGPNIGRKCAAQMRAVRDAGHEVGIHCWDHVRWQDGVANADAGWTVREFTLARERFHEVFGVHAGVHGAAGWQMNVHAFRLLDEIGYGHASDTRGTHPFLPAWKGECFSCPQLPTTLPTLDELIGREGLDATNVAAYVLNLTERGSNHVFTAHAELEGGELNAVFDALLSGWRAQGYQLVSLRGLAAGLDVRALPRHEVRYAQVAGRSGTLVVQGEELRP